MDQNHWTGRPLSKSIWNMHPAFGNFESIKVPFQLRRQLAGRGHGASEQDNCKPTLAPCISESLRAGYGILSVHIHHIALVCLHNYPHSRWSSPMSPILTLQASHWSESAALVSDWLLLCSPYPGWSCCNTPNVDSQIPAMTTLLFDHIHLTKYLRSLRRGGCNI